MKRPDWQSPWRRTDFREKPVTAGHTTPTAAPTVEDRVFVVATQPRILADLLAFSCAIRPNGKDWYIEPRSRAEGDRLLAFLKVRGVHGIIRRKRTMATQ